LAAPTHSLHDAVGHDRQRFAGQAREQQDQADIAGVRGGRHLDPAHGVALLRPGHDIGIDADRPDAEFRDDAVHRLEAVERVAAPGGDQAIRANAVDAAAFAQFSVGIFQHLYAFPHGEKLLDVVIGQDQGHDRGRCTN
jgi:hypothetical protein